MAILYVASIPYTRLWLDPAVLTPIVIQQAAVYDSLDGVHGLAGWRWLYLICGCMTVPVGLVTFFFLPDTPHKTRAWFLTQDDKDLALRRVEEAGKAAPASLTWKKAGRILRGWSECIWIGVFPGWCNI